MNRSPLLALALLLPSLAFAVPMQLQHTGRLLDNSGLPVVGSQTIDIGLYPTESSATAA